MINTTPCLSISSCAWLYLIPFRCFNESHSLRCLVPNVVGENDGEREVEDVSCLDEHITSIDVQDSLKSPQRDHLCQYNLMCRPQLYFHICFDNVLTLAACFWPLPIQSLWNCSWMFCVSIPFDDLQMVRRGQRNNWYVIWILTRSIAFRPIPSSCKLEIDLDSNIV